MELLFYYIPRCQNILLSMTYLKISQFTIYWYLELEKIKSFREKLIESGKTTKTLELTMQ